MGQSTVNKLQPLLVVALVVDPNPIALPSVMTPSREKGWRWQIRGWRCLP